MNPRFIQPYNAGVLPREPRLGMVHIAVMMDQ
jgi:hypothetical protein